MRAPLPFPRSIRPPFGRDGTARPPLWREARVGLEAAALMRDPVFRGDGLRDGRGRPVVLIPGFLAGDGSLGLMSNWLKRAKYRPVRAGMFTNVDCSGAALARLERRLDWAVAEQGSPAVIVGQSRGGSLAKALARRRPELVAGIVTLGSPQVDPFAIHPLVRLQVEAVSRLGSLGARPLPPLLPRGRVLRRVLGAPRRADARRRRLRVDLLAQRRRGRLARLPRPCRRRACGDRREPLRHGGEPGG